MKKNLFKLLFVMLFLLTVSFTFVYNNNTNVLADETETEEVVKPSLNIYKKNISYASEIYIMYAVSYEGIDVTTNPVKMLFYNSVQDEYTTQTASYVALSQGSVTIGGVSCQIFASNGLAAKQMTDDIYARAYVEINDEIIYSEVVKYSVLDYYYEIKEAGTVSANILNLLEAMVNYGAAAQINFNYNTEKLANATYYKVSVENAVLPDGFTNGRFKAEEQVTLTAPLKEGYVFTGWTNSNGDLVSTEVTYTLTVTQDETLTANYEEEVAVTPVTLTLTKEAAYDATTDALDLPSTVTFDYNNETVTENVTWDTTPFVVNQIGKQKLYGTLSNDSYKVNELSIEIDVLPYTFSLNEETNEYAITKYYGTSEEETIPATFNDTNIGAIGSRAFMGNASIQDVTFPDTFHTINSRAFQNCSSLKNINFSNCLTTIYSYAFYNCDSLTEIILPELIEKTSLYLFGNCDNLVSVELPKNLYYLYDTTFMDCVNLEKVIFYDDVEIIGNNVFKNCVNLREIYIPNSVTNIQNTAFYGCSSLVIYCEVSAKPSSWYSNWNNENRPTYWNVNSNNFVVIDGVSYYLDDNLNSSIITRCNNNVSNVIIPQTITLNDKNYNVVSVGSSAFKFCNNLLSISLPDSVNEIQSYSFYGCSSLISMEIPESITSIGVGTFSKCSGLIEIKIPDKITNISAYLFSGCTNLSRVKLSNSITEIHMNAFRDCVNLLDIELPDSLSKIESAIFSGCDNLKMNYYENGYYLGNSNNPYLFLNSVDEESAEIYVNENCKLINEQCLYPYSTTNIKTIFIPESVTFIGQSLANKNVLIFCEITDELGTWDENWNYNGSEVLYNVKREQIYSFNEIQYLLDFETNTAILTKCLSKERNFNISSMIEHLNIEYEVKEIKSKAFYSKDLISITLPNSIENIGSECFAYCTYLENIVLPDNLNSISDSLFEKCSQLKKITLPNRITEIGDNAFSECSNLEKIIIPNNVTKIGVRAFKDCSNLNYIEISDNVISIGKECFINCISLLFVDLPDGMTIIEEGIFKYCNNIKEITIPINASKIAQYAFYECCSLTSITIPSSIQSIEKCAFAQCTELTIINFSEGLKYIGEKSFYGCNKLSYLEFPESLNEIENYAFLNSNNLQYVFLPKNLYYVGNNSFTSDYLIMYVENDNYISNWNSNWNSKCRPVYWNINLFNLIDSDDMKFIIETETNTAILTKYLGASEDVVIPDFIEIDNQKYIVSILGEESFNNNIYLNSVVISSKIKEIRNKAFYNCANLKTVYNLSNFELTIGSTDFGYVSYYAKEIYTSLPEEE